MLLFETNNDYYSILFFHLAPGWFSVLHLVQEMIQMELTKKIEKPTATIISFGLQKIQNYPEWAIPTSLTVL